jgi:small-conductance mechanosensitive channel
MGKTSAVKEAVKESVSSVVNSSALAGKINSTFRALFVLSKDDIDAILTNVCEAIHVIDLIVLCAIGWLCVPTVGVVYAFLDKAAEKGKKKIKRVASTITSRRADSTTRLDSEEDDDSYENSYTYQMAVLVSQMAKLALLVYLCDIAVVGMHSIGYDAADLRRMSTLFTKILYMSWFARRIQSVKSYYMNRLTLKAPENCDKVKLVNNVLDLSVLALLGVKIMDLLSLETGFAFTSVAFFGTTSTLIISLASQEFAKGVTAGIEMSTSDRFYEGDNCHFGDGTQGYIEKMGFLRTKVRKYDGSILDIPNTQLGGQRLVNVSKTKTCQVLTKIHFEYDVIQKIPGALEICKEEIKSACPKLITEGKPFRAKISALEIHHVEVTFNTHFRLPPTGEEFWANRQELFLAIDRGVKKAGLDYAHPIDLAGLHSH